MWKNLFLILIGTLLLFHPPIDPDFGWHYKYGEYVFKNQQILKENVFSYTLTDYKWANSYWISEVALYTLFTYTGAVGMSLILSILMSAIVVFILNKAKIGTLGKFASAILFFVVAGGAYTSIRPFYFSTIFLLTLSYILIYKKNWQFILPAVFLIWANMHADFTLGLFIYAIFTISEIFENKFKNLIKLSMIPILSVVTTLINPYGIKLWETLLKETHYFQFEYILEWLPLSFHASSINGTNIQIVSAISLMLSSLLYAGIISAYFLDKKVIKPWYLVASTVFFLLSFRSVYFIRILSVLAVLPAAFFWNFALTFGWGNLKKDLKRPLIIVISFFMILLTLIVTENFTKNLEKAGDITKWTEPQFPYKAVEYLKANKRDGNIFNNYNWGGYIIWQLPEKKVFIDGRMPSWRENGYSLFEDYIAISTEPEKNMALFKKYADQYNITMVLDTPKSKLIKKLMQTGEWKIAHETKDALLVVKR